ncbi:MAG: hypothetical protein R3D44_02515 [Hyphomicrobiaceae bacterium]
MKTIFATLLALGLLSTAASAQWCPPGAGYGKRAAVEAPAVAVAPAPAPVEPAPAPEPAPEQQPAPEPAPPK